MKSRPKNCPNSRRLKADRTKPQLMATAGTMRLNAAGDAADNAPVTMFLEAYSGGVMYPQIQNVNWRGPVVVDLDGMVIEADSTPCHRDHDLTRPVGHATPQISNGQLVADGVLSVPGQDTDQIIQAGKNGFPWKVSVGLSNLSNLERIVAGQSVTCNGRQFQGPILVVRNSHLDELSILSVPGDYNTTAAINAARLLSSNGASNVKFSDWLAEKGVDVSTLTAVELDGYLTEYHEWLASEEGSAGANGEGEGNANAGGDDDDASANANQSTNGATATANRSNRQAAATANRRSRNGSTQRPTRNAQLNATRQAIADEEDRVEAIRAIGDTIGNPEMENGSRLVAHAIREGWSVQQTTLHARRAARPAAPAIHSRSTAQTCTAETLQAALLLRAGRQIDRVMPDSPYVAGWMTRPVNDPERDRIMNNAYQFRNGSLMAFVERSLVAAGRDVPSGDNRHAVLRAAFSSHSVDAVFNQSIGSMALLAYAEARDFSRGWVTENDALNLLESERPKLKAAPNLQRHPTGGPANHVKREANSETVQAERYSQFAKIDENDFINDNFSLLADTPRDFGRAAARLVPSLVAAVMLANPTLKRTGRALFNTTDANLIASNALTRDNLQKARARLSMMKDGDATLNLEATHLIVPSTLGDLAIELTKSAVISNDSGQGNMNPIYSRNVTPVEEARLANGLIHPYTGATLSGSLTSWYLISAEGKTIEVQYLAGTGRQPIVDVEALTQSGEFGLAISCKHFAGAAALDCLCMIRNDA